MYNNNDPLKLAKDALDRAIQAEKNNKAFLASIGPAIISALSPVLSELKTAVSKLKVDVLPQITINPEVKIPPISVPPINYTPPDVIVNYTPPKLDVNVPKTDFSSLRLPDLKWPKGEMSITGSVSLRDIDLSHPLPVQLRDAKGNPVILGQGGGGSIIAGGGGGFREVNATIVGASGSLSAALVDSGGNQYSGSNPLPVTITSGGNATSAVNVVDSSGVPFTGSNPLPTTLSLTTHLDVQQLSGSIDSVNVQQYAGNPAVVGSGYQDNAVRVVHATDAVVSVNIVGENQTLEVLQVSGSVFSVNVVGENQSLEVVQVSGAVNSVNIVGNIATLDVKQASGGVDSVNIVGNIATLDVQIVSGAVVSTNNLQTAGNPTVVGSGYQDNALRVVHATDAIVSVNIVGEKQTLEVLQVSGGVNSSQGKLIARTTNPTAASDATSAFASSDDLGRTLTRPIQVRDLTVTAYTSITTGTEATLLAGTAGKYMDLIYILASNNSTAAIGIDIRPSTAGSIIMHLEIPANGVVGVAPPVPIPQQSSGDGTGGSWTVDLPDVTGTTVYVSALFSNEI